MKVLEILKEMLENELGKTEDFIKKDFESWVKDPLCDFYDKEVQEIQEAIWEVESLIKRAEKYDIIKKYDEIMRTMKNS